MDIKTEQWLGHRRSLHLNGHMLKVNGAQWPAEFTKHWMNLEAKRQVGKDFEGCSHGLSSGYNPSIQLREDVHQNRTANNVAKSNIGNW